MGYIYKHMNKRLNPLSRNSILRIRKRLQSLSLLFLLCGILYAQDETIEETNPYSIIIPGPEPFSLDDRSAIYCINLLRNNRYIEINEETGKSEIVEVHTVWSYFLGLNENYPAGHHLRYDIIVNGEPINWDDSYIEYGGDMINLRLLFLYRNQYPPSNLQYRHIP
jgi:hypothetical protein